MSSGDPPGLWDAVLGVLAPRGIRDERHLGEIVGRARRHGVEAGVVDQLVGTGAGTVSLAAHRADLQGCTRAERLRSLQGLDALSRTLGVPFLVVKGPVIALNWYDEPSHRRFSDIDVLVRRADFAAAFAALEREGAASLTSNWHGFVRHQIAETPLELGSTVIDLHWDLVALGRDRRSITFDTDAMMERSVPVNLSGIRLRTLDDIDTLIHRCVNVGLDGGRQLGSLTDIAQMVHRADIDADELAARARRIGAGPLCAAVLQRTRLVLGVDIPDAMIRSLRAWHGWLISNHVLDRAGRIRNSVDSVAPGLWLSSGRSTRRATALALGTRGTDRIREALGRPSMVQPGGELDWQRTSADPAGARRVYLAWVAEGDGLSIKRRVGSDDAHARLSTLEPRTTPLLAAARSALRSRRTGSFVVVEQGDELLGALLTERWLLLRRIGYPIVLADAAVPIIADLVDRLGVTDLAGFDEDVLPIRPLVARWRRATPYTGATLRPGFRWGTPPSSTRLASLSDLDVLTELMWRHAGHGFPHKFQLRRRLRHAIDDLVVVTVFGNRVVGFAARDGTTRSYHHWAHIVVEPQFRGAGRSWDLVAAAASAASAQGAGLLGFFAGSNPMPVPSDAIMSSTWWTVALGPPRRWPGEPSVRAALTILAGWHLPRRRADLPDHRTPGGRDDLVTTRRTQIDWSEHQTGDG